MKEGVFIINLSMKPNATHCIEVRPRSRPCRQHLPKATPSSKPRRGQQEARRSRPLLLAEIRCLQDLRAATSNTSAGARRRPPLHISSRPRSASPSALRRAPLHRKQPAVAPPARRRSPARGRSVGARRSRPPPLTAGRRHHACAGPVL